MANTIGNSDNVIDSRDVLARIEYLQGEIDAHDTQVADDHQAETDCTDEAAGEYAASIIGAPDDPMESERNELAALQSLADDASGYAADWQYGETLIRDSYFKEYAMELAEDIGAIDRDAKWPNTCIDWEQASDELKMDYTQVDFDGVAYWIR